MRKLQVTTGVASSPSMKLSMIAAMDKNRLIGSNSGIPWHLPRDQHHFRSYSADKAMLLGRQTFSEMIGWFTSQRPIVLTRDASFDHPNTRTANSIEEALEMARADQESELLVAGGGEIYALAMPLADELLITEINAEFSGDTHFPEILPAEWRETSREHFQADDTNPYAMSLVIYQRR